jgi:protein phosphatase
MGQGLDLSVEIGVLALRRRDCLVLCSDGLTKHITDDEIRDAVLAAPSLAAACEALIECTNRRGGEDNVTVVLAGVNGDVPLAAAADGLTRTFRRVSSFEERS